MKKILVIGMAVVYIVYVGATVVSLVSEEVRRRKDDKRFATLINLQIDALKANLKDRINEHTKKTGTA